MASLKVVSYANVLFLMMYFCSNWDQAEAFILVQGNQHHLLGYEFIHEHKLHTPPTVCGRYTQIGAECFMVVKEKMPWPDAQEHCKQNGGDLAFPQNLEALQDYLTQENEAHDYWLGGTDEAEEGTWTWLSGESIVDSWKANQPSGGKIQNCLDFRSDHFPSLNDYECDEPQYFICEKNLTVLGNYTQIGAEWFMVVKEKMSWPDAQEHCKQNDGDLASPKNLEALQDYLKQENMKSPPVITKQARNEVLYEQPDKNKPTSLMSPLLVILECEAEGRPKPEFRWKKNGSPIVWQADPRIELEDGTGNLLITDPDVNDNGLYQCLAYNEHGTAISDPIHLLNTKRIVFEKTEIAYEVKAELGRPFKLTCPKATAYPKPTMTWMKSFANDDPTMVTMESANNDRTTTDPEGNLWFTHITEEDDSTKNSFKFMCLGSTSFSPADLSLGSIIHLNVTPPSDPNYENPSVNIEPIIMYTSADELTFKAAEENTLWCIFGGEPSPKVTWKRKDGQEIDDSRFMTRNAGKTLVINNTMAADSGEYVCQSENGVGEAKTKQFMVSVEVAPTFKQVMASQIVQPGANVTFTCENESTDKVSYQWYVNGRPMSTGNSHRKIVEDKLIITDVSTADIGNYACNATSKLGYAYGNAALNVIHTDYWLGGTDEAEEGTWTWLSGGSIVDSWMADQPSGGKTQNCLDFRSENFPSLNDYECDEQQYFICESNWNIPLENTTTESLDTTTEILKDTTTDILNIQPTTESLDTTTDFPLEDTTC